MRRLTWLFAALLPLALLAWQTPDASAATTATKSKSSTAAKPNSGDKPPAQGRGPGMGAGNRMEAMAKELKLSKAQQDKINALNAEFRKKMESIRNSKMTDEQKRAKAMENAKAHREAFMKVLTPEQQKKFNQKMEEQRKKFQNSGRPGDKPAGGKQPGGTPPKKK